MNLFERLRALGWFFLALLYFFFAQRVALHAAQGFARGDWFEVIERLFLLFLLVTGYALMGMVGQRQPRPVKAMGLDARPGWRREFALGSALGWAGTVACVLPVALAGGLAVTVFTDAHQFVALLLDLLTVLLATLLEEVAFRGYPFQRLIEAIGPAPATGAMAVLFGSIYLRNPDSTAASTLVAMLLGWLLAVAYLRTRALWVGWGFHFGWSAAMALLFGLPVSGITSFSPVIASNANGPAWLTGDGYGPEGSAIAAIAVLVLLAVLVRATRDLKYQYAQPVIVPGGIPVDLDAISRRQHEAAMGPAAPVAAGPSLVQILPANQQVTPPTRDENEPRSGQG